MDEIRDEYDFSQGARGKFYVPASEIRLPHYLEPKLEQSLNEMARQTGQSPDALLKTLLEKELRA